MYRNTRHVFVVLLVLYAYTGMAQQNHVFRLPEGIMISEQVQSIAGKPIWKQYEREWHTMEAGDSIVYLETYLYDHYWRLNRYVITDGKPRLMGWQNVYDKYGLLEEQLLCKGTRRCHQTVRYTYYPGGQLMSMNEYYKNERHGAHYMLYANGQLRQYIIFENDKLMDISAYYDASGLPLEPGTLCNGDGYAYVYAMNGAAIKVKYFSNGKLVKEEMLH